MTRPLRVNREGGWNHVFARRINRMTLFEDERDRRHFLELLEAVVERYRVELHAYVLMDNHYHLLVCTPEGNLSRAIQWLNMSYAAWFNARHQLTGPVFQRPFGSVPVQDGEWIYELSLYIHLNPLRITSLGLSKRDRKAANMGATAAPSRAEVTRRMRQLRQFEWSSYPVYAGYAQLPPWLCTDEILKRAAKQTKERHRSYRRDVQKRASEGGEPDWLEALRDRVAVGGAGFVRSVKELGAKAGIGRETRGKRQLRARLSIEDITRAVARERGESWEQILNRHGDTGTALAMWLARRYTGSTLQEIGVAMGGKDYAAVGMAILRFDGRIQRDRKLQTTARRVARMLDVKMSP